LREQPVLQIGHLRRAEQHAPGGRFPTSAGEGDGFQPLVGDVVPDLGQHAYDIAFHLVELVVGEEREHRVSVIPKSGPRRL